MYQQNALGTYTVYVDRNGGNSNIIFGSSDNFTGSIDNVSVKEDLTGDFTFSRSSAATRVNAQGLVENVQIISPELVSNGNFSQIGTEEVSNGNFSQEGSELILNPNFNDNSFWGVEVGVTIANNRANFNTAQTNYGIFKSSLLTNNKTYKVQLDITDYTSGGVHFNIGGVAIGNYTALGTHTAYVSSASWY